jgi:hypothetical protein
MTSYYHQDRISNYIKNFPFPTLREKQSFVLNEIDAAFASGYNHIIVEAPTGFGSSLLFHNYGLHIHPFSNSYSPLSLLDLDRALCVNLEPVTLV